MKPENRCPQCGTVHPRIAELENEMRQLRSDATIGQLREGVEIPPVSTHGPYLGAPMEPEQQCVTLLSQADYDNLVRDAMLWRARRELDNVVLSEARYYRNSKDPIGLLARELLRANGEIK